MMSTPKQRHSRCAWPGEDALMVAYHDEEWGTPLHDDRKLFEFMVLDSFQAGLSWRTILHRREGFRKAFANFDPQKVALFGEKEIEVLKQDKSIIRNRLKIQATITNAQAFLKVQEAFGSFDQYIWQFTGGEVLQTHRPSGVPARATSPESDRMSKDLKARGFKFAGSTICYAFMQAAGMINDHHTQCFRYQELSGS